MIQLTVLTSKWLSHLYNLECQSFSVPWSEKSLQDVLENPRYIAIGITDDNHLLGYLLLSTIEDEGSIDHIAVVPEYRGKGFGSLLMSAAIEVSVKMRLHFLTLEVRESNLSARKLYEKFLFEEVGRRKRYYHNPEEDAIILTRKRRK